jgi:ABC-type multidrug transport system ATPase subunit
VGRAGKPGVSLLELTRATKRFTSGQRETIALRDVSLGVDAGELVAVYGLRRSGRTTLLRVAAGMLPLDEGEARFDGRDLSATGSRALGVEIGYCNPSFDPGHGGSVAEHVAVALLARGAGRGRARAQADAALARTGASGCANLEPRELHTDELVRAGIARALVTTPRLLLLDEPTNGVDVLERDAIVQLLRSLADEGVAVLMTVGEALAGADRVLALDGGRLRGEPAVEQAPVVPLRPRDAEPVA